MLNQHQARRPFRRKWSKHELEQLEQRQLMASNAVQSLPFRLDFNQSIADSIADKDGQGTGLTRVQANKLGNEYQPGLIDLNTGAGTLSITTTGSATAGSNGGSDNTLANALETQFDGTTSGFNVTARLIGPLGFINDPYEQAGIYFGPNQDNYVKLVAIKLDSGQYLQFKDEINGTSSLTDTQSRLGIGSFSSISTLDVRLVGDAATGKVSAYYSVNGAAFNKLAFEYTINSASRPAFFNGASRAGLIASHKNNIGPITAVFDSFEIVGGTTPPPVVVPPPPPPPSGDAAATLSRGKVYLSDQTNTSASSLAQNVRLTNTGGGVLTLSGLSISGANAGEFSVRDAFGNPITTPVTLQAGQRVDLYITFKAVATGIRSATLNVVTSAGTQTVSLRALGLAGAGGSLEPSLQRIFDLYQIGVNVGDNDPSTTDFPVDSATSADEVAAPRFVKAGSNPVTVEILGVFANQVSKTTFGWYEAGNPQTKNILAQINAADNQSIAPLQDGSFSFDPGSGAFGIYGNFTLGSTSNPLNRDVYSESSLNTWETNVNRQKKVRVYKLKDANGVVTPNAYVVTFEEYNVTFDQNDVVAIIRNVQPAADAPEIGLENRDAAAFADRLSMSRIRQSGWNTNLPNQFHDTSTLRVRNTGSQPLNITGTTISNSEFVILSGGGARTLAPGAYVDLIVKFVYDPGSGNGNSLRSATLTINSNDSNEASKVVKLSGLWQSHSEDMPVGGSAEPTLQKIIDTFGYKVTTGNLNTSGNAVRAGQEILSELWQRADAGLPVGVLQLATYHQQYHVDYSTKSTISWYNPLNINGTTGKPNATKIFSHSQVDSQSILPRIDGSSTAPASANFNPGSVTQFGIKVEGYYSTDVYNTPNEKGNAGHAFRFYQARDQDGKIIPNAYIVAQDYVGVSYANYDYQDNIYLLTNIKPALAPSSPSGLAATAQAGGIALNWNDNTEGNVTGYNVYRATSSGGVYTLIAGVTGSDYVDAAAPQGATSYYKVAATTYQNQESPQSSAAGAFLAGAGSVPAAPNNVVASATTATSVLVVWNDAGNNETGFRIERKTGSGAFASVGTVAAGVTAFTDSMAQASTTYTYRVIAFNSAGDSAASNESTTTTPAAQPRQTVLTSTNIGNPTPAGSITTVTPGKDYDVSVGGLDIWGTYDSFNFLHEQRTGDFDVAVRVSSLAAFDGSTMAGLMARESLGTGSRNVMIKARSSGYRFHYRSSTNGTSVGVGSATASFPNAYVRLKRAGNTFTSYISSDGVNWTSFQSVTMSLPQTLYVGLATSAHTNAQATTAQYRGYGNVGAVQQPAAPTGLTSSASNATTVALNWTDNAGNETGYRVERKTGSGAWQTVATLGANASAYSDTTVVGSTTYTYRVLATGGVDSNPSNESTVTTPAAQPGQTVLTSANIGNPTPAGSITTVTPGKDYNVTVGGLDIWGTSDSFNFLHQQRTGDFDVAVRVTNLASIDESTMAGLMARESLSAGSRNVMIKVRSSGYRFHYRPSTNGTSVGVGTATASLPNAYIRLKRIGNQFISYISNDGVNWTTFQSVTKTLPQTLYVGLATSAHTNAQATTAQYRGFGNTGTNVW